MDPKLFELLEDIKTALLESPKGVRRTSGAYGHGGGGGRGSDHNPFKRKSRLGTTGAHRDKNAPAPYSTRSVNVTNDWDCHSDGSYKQICKGPEGRTKVVRISPSYKKSYNKSYKSYMSRRRRNS